MVSRQWSVLFATCQHRPDPLKHECVQFLQGQNQRVPIPQTQGLLISSLELPSHRQRRNDDLPVKSSGGKMLRMWGTLVADMSGTVRLWIVSLAGMVVNLETTTMAETSQGVYRAELMGCVIAENLRRRFAGSLNMYD